jgi:phosphoadenosine phosphosulfate reductase
MLQDKINYSIDLLRKHEATALKMNPDGYYLAFSGGKDSQVIYELCKMAGVKFKAHFACTTVDPKEVLHFIHEKYPDVIWHRPKKSMFKLIEEQGCLPLMNLRFCCRLIKEIGGINNIVITGVRTSESRKRAERKEIEHMCIKGEDKILLKPIFNWRTAEVWNFVRNTIGYYCVLYDMGYHRVGCIACPNASVKNKRRDLRVAPRFEYAYKKAIKKCIAKGSYEQFDNEDDVFSWWIGGGSIKKYLANKQQCRLEF